MGQEAYSMFPALAEMQARSQLMKAQAASEGYRGQEFNLRNKQYGQEQQALGVLGSDWASGGPSVAPVPGSAPMPPQPGEASQPKGYGYGGGPFKPAGIRVPAAGGPAMQGPGNSNSDPLSKGPRDQMLPQAAQPPAIEPDAQPAHKWTAGPGEQHDTPDGSRPRSFAEVIGAMRKANPKADNATLARAAQAFLPWMTEEDQVRLRETTMENTAAIHASDQAAQAQRSADVQAAITDRSRETQAEISDRSDKNRASRKEIAAMNIDARQKIAMLRDDVAYAAQRQKADEAANKLEFARERLEATKSQDASENYFRALRAKEEADYNIINMMWANRDITDEEKAQAFADIQQTKVEAAAALKKATGGSRAPVKIRTQKEEQPLRIPGSTGPFLDPGGASSFN